MPSQGKLAIRPSSLKATSQCTGFKECTHYRLHTLAGLNNVTDDSHSSLTHGTRVGCLYNICMAVLTKLSVQRLQGCMKLQFHYRDISWIEIEACNLWITHSEWLSSGVVKDGMRRTEREHTHFLASHLLPAISRLLFRTSEWALRW